ncbi:hypothetical protein V1506DRAFT_555634 [Lipomyces tetrasporus]
MSGTSAISYGYTSRARSTTAWNSTTPRSTLKSNAPEQWLDIQMPYSQYLKLEECCYPRLSYNSVTETVTVVTVPRNLHEVAASELRRQIMNGIVEHLSHHSPESLGRIVDAGSSDADGLFQYRGPDVGPATVTYEVGFSQSYDSLLGNKDVWIQGCHAKACVLICLNESPRFRNPTGPFEDIGDVEAEKQAMSRHANAVVPLDGLYFPQISYRDHVWAGGVTEAFIEVWRADGHEKFPLIEDRGPHHNLTTTLGLHVSDFFEDDAWQAMGIEDLNILFDGTLYLTLLESGMVKLAEGRFADFITTP